MPDDVLAPDKITRQLGVLKRDAGQHVASGEWARFIRDTSDAVFVPEPVWADLSPVSWLCASWSGGGMMHPAAWLVPRDVAQRAGQWDESLSLNDDGEHFSRVLLASAGVKFCQGARAYYRSGNSASLSASTSRRAWESGWRAVKASTDHLLAAETSDRTRRACADALQRYAYDAHADAPDLAEQAAARAMELGGAGIAAPGGPWFQRISRTLGWRAALRVRSAARTTHGARRLVINLFYEEPEDDRWIRFDRYPRRVLRRAIRGTRRVGGHERVFLNLCAGLRRLGVGYRVNDYRFARQHPSERVGIIGKPHVLAKLAWRNPIALRRGRVFTPDRRSDPALQAAHRTRARARRMDAPHVCQTVVLGRPGRRSGRWASTPIDGRMHQVCRRRSTC